LPSMFVLLWVSWFRNAASPFGLIAPHMKIIVPNIRYKILNNKMTNFIALMHLCCWDECKEWSIAVINWRWFSLDMMFDVRSHAIVDGKLKATTSRLTNHQLSTITTTRGSFSFFNFPRKRSFYKMCL
jgi:hypothetical protein